MDDTSQGSGLAWTYARFVVAARWWVIGFWALATVASVVLFPSLGGSGGGSGLKGILSADTPAVQVEKRSFELFGFPLIARTVVVQRDPAGLSPYAQARTVVRAVSVDTGRAGDVKPILGALPITNTAGLFPGSSENSTTALTYLLFGPDTSLGARTRAAHDYADRFFEPRDHVVGVTGSAPARDEQGDIITESLPTVELATLLAIMLIVGLGFRSLVTPALTVLTAGVAYVATFRVSGLVTQLFDLPSPDELKPVVVALLLGVVTDYVVFFCSALRNERGRGLPTRVASTRAIARSGPIVTVAGVAVAAGTATLLAATSPFFRALGPALAFTIVVGLLVAVTLVPALIAVLGDLIFWPSRPVPRADGLVRRLTGRTSARHRASTTRRRGLHTVVTRIASRRSVATVVLMSCLGGMLLAASPLLHLQLGVSFVSALPRQAPIRQTAISAQEGFALGILSPTVVLLQGDAVGSKQAALRRFGTAMSQQPGVAGVLGPGSQPIPVQTPLLVTRDENAARYLVVLDDKPLGADAVTTVDALESRLPTLMRASGLGGTSYGLSGDSATASFIVHQTESDLMRIAIAAMITNLLMLLVFLRAALDSVLLLLTSVLSVCATLGITTALFSWLDPGQGLTFYVPFAAAVLLLAFGSDYNIFTVGHVWEAASGRSVRGAVIDALPPAVVAVTAAGLALAASFGLLALVPLLPFRQLAFAVGLGILMDVLVVRTLMVPALLTLVGGRGTWPSRRFRGTPDANDSVLPSGD
ncbi:MAG: MMPL family transporter [Nocardioidaceae bacterium]